MSVRSGRRRRVGAGPGTERPTEAPFHPDTFVGHRKGQGACP